MNRLIENKYIEEMDCGANFSYILNNNNDFLSTEYKVLQGQSNSGFVRCMKMLYNGKIQLFYLTGEYKPLSSLLHMLDADTFMKICSNLIADVLDIKNNGFLSCENIDISFDRVYVDMTTQKIHLVYIPVSQRLFDDTLSFENELRTSMIKLIQGLPALSVPKTIKFAADLSNGTLSLENLYSTVKNGPLPVSPAAAVAGIQSQPKILRLIALNAPGRIEIEVTKDNFIIGKKKEAVDGWISFNKTISRSHCKITQNGSQYMITDLKSSNGTYVNHVKLLPDQPYPINGGDIVRLSNSDFQVSEGEGGTRR